MFQLLKYQKQQEVCWHKSATCNARPSCTMKSTAWTIANNFLNSNCQYVQLFLFEHFNILKKIQQNSPKNNIFLKICSLTQNRFDQKSIFSNIPDFYYLVFNKVLARDWFSIICFFSPDKTKGTTNVTHFLIFELIELWYECENEEGL